MHSAVSTALLRNLKLPYHKLCLEEASLHQSQILIFVSKSALSDQYVYANILPNARLTKKNNIV